MLTDVDLAKPRVVETDPSDFVTTVVLSQVDS